MASYRSSGDERQRGGHSSSSARPFSKFSSMEPAMNVPQNLRCFTFPICALLAVAGVLVISSPTLGEPSAPMPSQENGGKSVKAIAKPFNRPPGSAGWSRFYPPSNDCAEAKVDIWLTQGVASYSISVPGAGVRRPARYCSRGRRRGNNNNPCWRQGLSHSHPRRTGAGGHYYRRQLVGDRTSPQARMP